MLRSLIASSGLALALLLVPTVFDTADARQRGMRSFHSGQVRAFTGRSFRGPSFRGARIYSGRHFHRRFAGRHFRRGIYVGIPLAAYGAYAYSSSCAWLRHRALATGSPYWWERYYACRDGYDY